MSMTLFEIARQGAEPFLPPIYKYVRRSLLDEVRRLPKEPEILDVGGRKSPYTIGLPAKVTIIDLPRETEVQKSLNLGMTSEIEKTVAGRRSNIEEVLFGDMTRSDLPSDRFDLVVSVEVLEHVEEDEKFVSEICRVLKPGCKFFMTTPNGDFVENRNPDHKRHYKKEQLEELLNRHFAHVNVEYAIVGGFYRRVGLKPWSLKKPVQTGLSALGNIVNTIQSSREGIKDRALGTHHLFASATKPDE